MLLLDHPHSAVRCWAVGPVAGAAVAAVEAAVEAAARP